MKDRPAPPTGALQGRMLDVQENLLEFFSAVAMDGAMGWEDVQIEAPEPAAAERPALRLVA